MTVRAVLVSRIEPSWGALKGPYLQEGGLEAGWQVENELVLVVVGEDLAQPIAPSAALQHRPEQLGQLGRRI